MATIRTGDNSTSKPKRNDTSRLGCHRSTQEEKRDKVMFCYERMTRIPPLTNKEIVKAYREEYGEEGTTGRDAASPWTVRDHIADARRLLIINAVEHREEMRVWAFLMLQSVIQGEEIEARPSRGHIIGAVNSIIEMLGLKAPTKIALTDPSGEKPYEQMTDAELDARILAATSTQAED